MVWVLSILLAALPIAVCYAARWWLGRDRLQPVWLYPVLVAAGGLGGFLFALNVSPLLKTWFAGLDIDPAALKDAVVAPVAEEIGKGLVLLFFLPTRWYRSPVDGLLYGFAAGAGFAMVENLLYFIAAFSQGGEGDWLGTVALRLPASLVVHAGGTAIVGAYLGAARWERRALVVFAALPAALFLASAIHGGWNALLGVSPTSTTSALAALLLLPVVGGGLMVLLYLSLRAEAADVREELRPEVEAGRLDEAEVDLVAQRTRHQHRLLYRAPARSLASAAIALAYALRRRRREGRGDADVARHRAELASLRARRGATAGEPVSDGA